MILMKNRKLNPFTVHVPPEHCLTCNHKHNEKIMYFDPKQKNHTRKIRTLSVQYTTIITYMKLSRIFQVSTKKGQEISINTCFVQHSYIYIIKIPVKWLSLSLHSILVSKWEWPGYLGLGLVFGEVLDNLEGDSLVSAAYDVHQLFRGRHRDSIHLLYHISHMQKSFKNQ